MVRFPRLAKAYAEYVSAPAHELALKPAGVDHAIAASAPMIGLTAWRALSPKAGCAQASACSSTALPGGVGHVAVQLAREAGAEVIGTASTAHHDFVAGLGASLVVDHAKGTIEGAVRDVDLAIDHRGGDDFVRIVGVMRPGEGDRHSQGSQRRRRGDGKGEGSPR
jgi:NADPH:quinone reductase-like Zn-dependent oxidoreductase